MLFISSSVTWAYKAGDGADDNLASIPVYATVAAWLMATNAQDDSPYVKINGYTLPWYQLIDFHSDRHLTDNNLIKNYPNAAAWLADTDRTNNLYATFTGVDNDGDGYPDPFRVVVLEAFPSLSDTQLANADVAPNAVLPRPQTTAVGRYARATGYSATAVGDSAHAREGNSTAIGHYALALGVRSTALGQHAHAYDTRTTSLGRYSHAAGVRSTAVGGSANTYGERATALGNRAVALGARNTALGAGAITAKPNVDQYDDIGGLIECVSNPVLTGEVFIHDCENYITDEEKADSRYDVHAPTFSVLRSEIQTRLRADLAILSTNRATAVGTFSSASNERATAVGYGSMSLGRYDTAVGANSAATGERSTAVGTFAYATGKKSTALGQYARAHGTNTIAVGRNAVAGGADAPDDAGYFNAQDFLQYPYTGAPQTNVLIGDKVYSIAEISRNLLIGLTPVNGQSPGNADTYADLFAFRSAYYNLPDDVSPPTASYVQIGNTVYMVDDLQAAISNFRSSDLPNALVGNANAIAIGVDSRANNLNSIAIGQGATTAGNNAIAIGHDVRAIANQVVIGSSIHTYRLPGLATARGTPSTQVVTVDSMGRLIHDGGSLNEKVNTLRIDLTAETTNRESADATLRTDLTAETTNRESADATLRTDLTAETTNRESADAILRTDLGTTNDDASLDGSAHARIKQIQNSLTNAAEGDLATAGAIMRSRQAIARLGEKIDAVAGTATAAVKAANANKIITAQEKVSIQRIDAIVDGSRVVTHTLDGGNVNERLVFLSALIGKPVGNNEAVRDRDGNPVTTTLAEFKKITGSGDKEVQLFRYLYGDVETMADNARADDDPNSGILKRDIPDADSANPNVNSIVGRYQSGTLRTVDDAGRIGGTLGRPLTQVQKDALAKKTKGYEEATDISANANRDKPAREADRRIVVQDVNADGSIRLRTIANTLAGVDQQVRQRVERLDLRVTGLSRQLDKGIAMASALTALPNITPGNGRYALGLGVGNHGGASAFAIGFSGRVGESTYYNLGVATSGDSSTTSRAGVSWAW